MPGKHTLAAHKKQSIAEKPDEHKSHARHPVSRATASARRGRHPMLFDQRFDRCDQRAQRLATMGDRVLLGRLHFGGRELFAGVDRTLRLIVRHKQRNRWRRAGHAAARPAFRRLRRFRWRSCTAYHHPHRPSCALLARPARRRSGTVRCACCRGCRPAA